jgi:hypothetical protein
MRTSTIRLAAHIFDVFPTDQGWKVSGAPTAQPQDPLPVRTNAELRELVDQRTFHTRAAAEDAVYSWADMAMH